jgi:hypothetical protein
MIDPRPLALALTAPVYGVPAIAHGFAACLEPKGCTVK